VFKTKGISPELSPVWAKTNGLGFLAQTQHKFSTGG